MLWLILGILIGGAAVFLFLTEKVDISWYQWVLGLLAVAVFFLMLQNMLGFGRELESTASSFTLIAMGLPALILAALAVFLPKLIKKNKLSKTK